MSFYHEDDIPGDLKSFFQSAPQLGLEPTPEEHVEKMVEVFREVRRVLRADGVCWINYGDAYFAKGTKKDGHGFVDGGKKKLEQAKGSNLGGKTQPHRLLKQKDLIGMPWLVAFALQADGWWLRSDVIWVKPNPMPESVTDRPTKAHEHIFLLTKNEKYFYDADAVRESVTESTVLRHKYALQYATRAHRLGATPQTGGMRPDSIEPAAASRNLRDVWTIATQPFPGAHFATFPVKLVEPCIKAGTSEKGCCKECGTPWMRERDEDTGGSKGKSWHDHANDAVTGNCKGGTGGNDTSRARGYVRGGTIGWSLSCECDASRIPCIVLDPFGGSGTTGLVADRLGRDAILIELNREYADMARKRIKDDCPMLTDVIME